MGCGRFRNVTVSAMGERMRWSEAEEVVRAYRAEQGSTDVDVATLARALGTNVADVRRLAGRRKRFVDGSGVLSAALAMGVALAAFVTMGSRLPRMDALVARLTPPPAAAPEVEVAQPEEWTPLAEPGMKIEIRNGRMSITERDGNVLADDGKGHALWTYPQETKDL